MLCIHMSKNRTPQARKTPFCVVDNVPTSLDIVIPASETLLGVAALDKKLVGHYANTPKGEEVVAICTLDGAIPLCGYLETGAFAEQIRPIFGSTRISTRRNGTSAGEVQVPYPHSQSVTGRHALIIEDLLDSRRTMAYLAKLLLDEGALSVTIATLLDKPNAATHQLPDDVEVLAVFAVHKDIWTVGFGMDIDGKHRGGLDIRGPRIQLEKIPKAEWYRQLLSS